MNFDSELECVKIQVILEWCFNQYSFDCMSLTLSDTPVKISVNDIIVLIYGYEMLTSYFFVCWVQIKTSQLQSPLLINC